jgi:NitT/TauT family transport system substrate-binding protein
MTTCLTRRRALQLGAAVPALAWAAATRAQAPLPMKIVGAAAVARPDQGFMFAGITTGFYKDRGVAADFFTTAGSAAVLQLIATNQAQLGHCGMQELMATKIKNPTLPVKAVFLQEVGAGYEIVVPTSSPIKQIAELKGKRIGVISLASGAVPFIRSMLRTANVEPDGVELLPVGVGAQALAALRTGRVDALSLFRGSHAALENMGVELRYFTVKYPSSVMIANETFIRQNRAAVVSALQGIVLSQVYLRTSPEAGVRSFWQLHGAPKDEAKELKEGAHLVRRAAELWKPIDDARKWGLMSEQDWLSLAAFSGIDITAAQVASLFTNELIDDVNKVDIKVAIEAAKRK